MHTERELLQRYRVPNDIREVSPMFVAITDAPLNLVARMKTLGASLWELSSIKENALHVVRYSNVETSVKCEYLIRQDKTLIDRDNSEGHLPLHTAAYCTRGLICDAFINYGAELNAGEGDMTTPLHFSIFGCKPDGRHGECVTLLLECCVNILARDLYGRTALEVAIEEDRTGKTQFLQLNFCRAVVIFLHYFKGKKNIFRFEVFMLEITIYIFCIFICVTSFTYCIYGLLEK